MSVPIQALTVREMLYDAKGAWCTSLRRRARADSSSARRDPAEPAATPPEPPAGYTRKETEGVFVFRDGRAVFVPVKVGIAGERYFEVLSGVNGERPASSPGPFNSVRELADGAEVRLQETPGGR